MRTAKQFITAIESGRVTGVYDLKHEASPTWYLEAENVLFENCEIHNAEFEFTTFRNCKIQSTEFKNCSYDYTFFYDCDMSYVRFEKSKGEFVIEDLKNKKSSIPSESEKKEIINFSRKVHADPIGVAIESDWIRYFDPRCEEYGMMTADKLGIGPAVFEELIEYGEKLAAESKNDSAK